MTPRRRIHPESSPQRTLNTKRTGDILRQARQARGESLAQVSQAIKVRVSMLQAIEAGHFFGLTDPLYLKGFIRAYADHLGLAESEVMPFFRREYDEQQHQQQLAKPLAPIEPKKPKITPGRVIVTILTIAIVAVVGYSYNQYVSVALTPKLELVSPVDASTAASGQVLVKGTTDADAQLSLNGQPVTLTPAGDFELTVALALGTNTLQLKSVNKLGKSTVVERTVIGPPRLAQALLPTPTPTVLAESTSESQATSSATLSEVVVEVNIGPSSAWIEVQTDGQPAFSGLMLPGSTQSYAGTRDIHLKTGNAGSTRVSLHGVDQGLLGKDGEVVEKTYRK